MMVAARVSFWGALFGAVLLSSGCSMSGMDGMVASSQDPTPYQKNMLFGGYDDEELSPTVFKVTVQLNPMSKQENAVKMAYVRAAEIADERGFGYFEVTAREAGVICTSSGPWDENPAGGDRVQKITVNLLKKAASDGREAFEVKKILTEVRPQILQPSYSKEEKIANLRRSRMDCAIAAKHRRES